MGLKVRLVKCSTALIQSGFLSEPINILRAYLECSRIETDLSNVPLCSTKYLEWSSNGKTQIHYLSFELKSFNIFNIFFKFFLHYIFFTPFSPFYVSSLRQKKLLGKVKAKRGIEKMLFFFTVKKVKIKWKVREGFFFNFSFNLF